MGLAERLQSLQQAPVKMCDGRVLYLDLRNPVCMPYLMLGDFPCETSETEFVKSVVRPGDTVIDIGANAGWYTSLLCEIVGSQGRVYAFEPNNKLAALLNQLARHFSQMYVEAAGLGNCDGEECFRIPENWISGSFGAVPDAVETENVLMYKLDTFVHAKGISEVTFVKCDAEGAELDILSGAVNTICQERPPIWLIEMSSEETSKFNYHPKRLVEVFQEIAQAEYTALMVNQELGGLQPLVMPTQEPFWFNAVFVPNWLYHRIADLVAHPHCDPKNPSPHNPT